MGNSIGSAPLPRFLKQLLTEVEPHDFVIEGNCVRIRLRKNLGSLLDERGLVHGTSIASLSIAAAEIAISTLSEESRFIAMNTFISFVHQVTEPSSVDIEACIEIRTSIHAVVEVSIVADGIEVAKSNTLFLKLEGSA